MSCNVLLVVSDTFRYDLFHRRFYVKNGVKAKLNGLERFYSDAVEFTRAYHASFPTVPNRADLFTGRFTFTYYDWSPMPRNWITLPILLKKSGYTCMMVADTPHILKDGYHFDRGFDGWNWVRGQENDRYRTSPLDVRLPCSPWKLRSVETTVQHIRNNYYRRSEEDWIPVKTALEASRWLEENYGRKFFLYVDFFDPHEPWDPPRWYVDMYDPDYKGEEVIYPAYGPCDYLTEDELSHIRAMYAGEATLVDKWISFLLEKLDMLGLLENTTIIFTSDHGFYLGEHGLVGKSIIMGEYHGLTPLYEEVAHIPLIVRFADKLGLKNNMKVNALVQTPDITATILELAGLSELNETSIQGSSLIPLIKGEKSKVRNIAVSTPSLVRSTWAGLRATITADEWALILAPEASVREDVEKAEVTFIVDGEPRILKPFGSIASELYDLKHDLKQEENVIAENIDIARNMRKQFLKFLRSLNAGENLINPWLKCIGLD
ncbi:sulfatase [Candidatus Bathyarchaeota archaeon]|nr:sulfatase [Candidatus Bathyarchaeota archaeon]MBS7617375.1 sulfatase [Candidatus Bathyarchaeota archaeon]